MNSVMDNPNQTVSVGNEPVNKDIIHTSENSEKLMAVWTTSATLILLELYESKLEMLVTPKKKTRIWIAISECLKDHNIEVTPDQVRWKINALTKKYKQCLDRDHHKKFKYFYEMNSIYTKHQFDTHTQSIGEFINMKRKQCSKNVSLIMNNTRNSYGSFPESKELIELRKIRLANRIETDRSQGKIKLEKQWLEYLRRQEEEKLLRNELLERQLKLREEELELRKRELEMRESLEMRKLELQEKEYEETLCIEKEKCEILKRIFLNKS